MILGAKHWQQQAEEQDYKTQTNYHNHYKKTRKKKTKQNRLVRQHSWQSNRLKVPKKEKEKGLKNKTKKTQKLLQQLMADASSHCFEFEYQSFNVPYKSCYITEKPPLSSVFSDTLSLWLIEQWKTMYIHLRFPTSLTSMAFSLRRIIPAT